MGEGNLPHSKMAARKEKKPTNVEVKFLRSTKARVVFDDELLIDWFPSGSVAEIWSKDAEDLHALKKVMYLREYERDPFPVTTPEDYPWYDRDGYYDGQPSASDSESGQWASVETVAASAASGSPTRGKSKSK